MNVAALTCVYLLAATADTASVMGDADVVAPAHLSAQESQPIGDLSLDTWFVHTGALPTLAPAPGTGSSATLDALDEAALRTQLENAEAGKGFERVNVPVALDIDSRFKADPQTDGTWWLLARFTADREAVKRAVGIWVDINPTDHLSRSTLL